jgi:hypothetical protein
LFRRQSTDHNRSYYRPTLVSKWTLLFRLRFGAGQLTIQKLPLFRDASALFFIRSARCCASAYLWDGRGEKVNFTLEQATNTQQGEGGYKCSSLLSLIAAPDGDGWSTPRPDRF